MSREDLDELLNEGIAFASYLLEKRGEFYPFAVTKDRTGKIDHLHCAAHEEFPASASLRQQLFASLRLSAQRGEIVASAVVSNTSLTDRSTARATDAIRLELESQNDPTVICYIPFEFRGGALEKGELMAESGPSITFDQRT